MNKEEAYIRYMYVPFGTEFVNNFFFQIKKRTEKENNRDYFVPQPGRSRDEVLLID